jgi:hypothetical protein
MVFDLCPNALEQTLYSKRAMVKSRNNRDADDHRSAKSCEVQAEKIIINNSIRVILWIGPGINRLPIRMRPWKLHRWRNMFAE